MWTLRAKDGAVLGTSHPLVAQHYCRLFLKHRRRGSLHPAFFMRRRVEVDEYKNVSYLRTTPDTGWLVVARGVGR